MEEIRLALPMVGEGMVAVFVAEGNPVWGCSGGVTEEEGEGRVTAVAVAAT